MKARSVSTDEGDSPVIGPERRLIGWVLLAGLVLRLGLLVSVRDTRMHIDDERTYAALATSIGEGSGFAYENGQTTSGRPPLFPAFVAGLWKASGSSSLQVVRGAQVVLSLASVLLLFLLARHLFNREIAFWAALFWCFYPSYLYAGVLILTEVLFTFLMLLGCLCAVLALTRTDKALRWAFATGVSFGLAALTRSVLWPFPIALIPAMLVVSRLPTRKRLMVAAALGVGYLLTVAPWAIRNTRIQKTFVVVDTMSGLNLRMGNYEYTPEDHIWDAVSLKGDQA